MTQTATIIYDFLGLEVLPSGLVDEDSLIPMMGVKRNSALKGISTRIKGGLLIEGLDFEVRKYRGENPAHRPKRQIRDYRLSGVLKLLFSSSKTEPYKMYAEAIREAGVDLPRLEMVGL